MATQQIVSSVSPQQKSAVVPFPAPPQPITQLELAALLSLRGRLHQLEEQVEEAEQSIQARLEAGSSVEGGDHSAKLKTNSRRNVAWKDVVVRLADRLKMDGTAYCARVLASTKPTKTITLVVV
jgi:hypothetical protein